MPGSEHDWGQQKDTADWAEMWEKDTTGNTACHTEPLMKTEVSFSTARSVMERHRVAHAGATKMVATKSVSDKLGKVAAPAPSSGGAVKESVGRRSTSGGAGGFRLRRDPHVQRTITSFFAAAAADQEPDRDATTLAEHGPPAVADDCGQSATVPAPAAESAGAPSGAADKAASTSRQRCQLQESRKRPLVELFGSDDNAANSVAERCHRQSPSQTNSEPAGQRPHALEPDPKRHRLPASSSEQGVSRHSRHHRPSEGSQSRSGAGQRRPSAEPSPRRSKGGHPPPSEAETGHQHSSEDKRRAAELCVQLLMPHFRAGRVASKHEFKALARRLAHDYLHRYTTIGRC